MNGIIRTLLSLKGRSSNSSLRDAPIGFGCSSVPNKSPCEESSHQSQLYLIFQNPVETEQLKFIILRILSFFAHRHHSQLGHDYSNKKLEMIVYNFFDVTQTVHENV